MLGLPAALHEPMPPPLESVARQATPLVELPFRFRLHERVRFLCEFARHPRSTGAIGPSSPELAHAMVRDMGLERAKLVVELGAGTGAFTSEIVASLPSRASLVAMELNPRLAGSLEDAFPSSRVRVVCDSAERLCRHLGRPQTGRVDAVVSGLPWVFFSAEQQRAILQQVRRALRRGGRFATFAYAHAAWLPSGVKFRRELRAVFPECRILPIVWRNLPPAFIYRCRR